MHFAETAITRPAIELVASEKRLTDKQAIAFSMRFAPCRLAAASMVRRGLVWILESAPAMPPRPLSRERWIAEVCRLLVEKYALEWPVEEIDSYAESLAETYYDDVDWREAPDAAIEEDFVNAL